MKILMQTLLSLLVTLITFGSAASEKILRWGADSESGVPYAYRDPKNPEVLVGFEVDIVEALAKEMGMKPVFVQNSWDGLVPGLKANNYDIVINGLEITDDRKEEIGFSNPYYITYEQLVVRKTTYDVNRLDDLVGKPVGTLDGALAQRILEQVKGIEVKPYDEEVLSFDDLGNGRIEAVLLDAPIVLYYAKPRPDLKLVGAPISRLEYGIGIRKKDTELLNSINAGLRRLVENGTMRRILEKWAMWNPQVAEIWKTGREARSEPSAYYDYLKSTGQIKDWKAQAKQYASYLPMLGRGALMTIEISLLAMILAITFGLVNCLVRLYGPKPLSFLALSFVEVFRGTPLLIQLYLIFYGLPHIGIQLSPFLAAIIGLGLNYAACESENYRAGILSIPKAQMDAAFALGMGRIQALRHVIVPQAMRLVIPPVTNDFIALLKDSSLVSVITLVELTTVYGQLASTYFDYLGIGVMAAAVYFLIGLPFVRLSRMVERHFAFDSRRPRQILAARAEDVQAIQPA